MMTVLPLAKIGLLLNRPKYVQEAKKQVLIHIKSVPRPLFPKSLVSAWQADRPSLLDRFLQDKKTGLFFHGWTDHEGGHNVGLKDMTWALVCEHTR